MAYYIPPTLKMWGTRPLCPSPNCAHGHMCMLCGLIDCFKGGKLFDWDRLGNFMITRDRTVGNKVKNTKCHT